MNLQALDGVGHHENTASPGVVKTVVIVAAVLGIAGLVRVVRAVKRFVVQNA